MAPRFNRITLRLALSLLLAIAVAVQGCDGSDPGGSDQRYVRVNVTNTTHQPIVGAAVNLGGRQATTGNDGTTPEEAILVPVGERVLTVTAAGYNTYTSTFNIQGATTLRVELRGPNQVSGQVLNSQNGQGIDGAAITFSRNGRVELTETTGASGTFSIVDAPDGVFDLAITKPGFVDYHQAGVNITGGSFVLDPIALSETVPVGAIRIVVTWGVTPSDLDAHLTGPDGAGGRFHVYYSNTSAGDATLDHDDTSSNGPETITITIPHNGMYRYSIHNYSDQSTSGGQGIAASPTRVQVYDDSGLIKSYVAPAATSGNTWRVFELTVNGVSRTFSDNGGASLGYVQAASSSDTGVFLTGGGDAPGSKGIGR
jgi:hypothetical protein